MEKELIALGLSNYESRVLNTLFRNKINLQELSKKANVPFGKIYSIVKSLKEKNLVKETNSRPKLIYVENASKVIARLIEEKKNKETNIFETLREQISDIEKDKNKATPFFQIGTNIEENKKIQLRSFTEAKREVLQIINIHHKPESNRESKTLWEKEIVKAVKKGIVFKSIYPEDSDLPIILKRLMKDYPKEFIVKRLNTDFVRCDVIDGENVLIKLVQRDPLQFGGVLFIENEKLAENLTKIFNELWDNARED